MDIFSNVLAGYTPQRASSSVPPLPTLNVMVQVHVRVIILTTFNAISKIISFKLNHYLELYQLRKCSMRYFIVWLGQRNIFVTSHNGSTDSHACSDSQSVPRPTNVARYKITQQEQERQLPMSLRSPQQIVSYFGRPHLFTPRSADPWNIIGQRIHSAMCTYWTLQILYRLCNLTHIQ